MKKTTPTKAFYKERMEYWYDRALEQDREIIQLRKRVEEMERRPAINDDLAICMGRMAESNAQLGVTISTILKEVKR